MTFKQITSDTSCDCLKEAFEDNTSIYSRLLKRDTVTDKDFLSKWEKNNRPEGCELTCLMKGVSINKIDSDEVKEKVKDIYRRFKLSPKYKTGVLLFRLAPGAGVIRHTPSPDNPYHHTLYKSDEFSLDMLTPIDVEILNQSNVQSS
jgi:CRISPR/Cas system CSM-associated protein Csm4 (group 5 of RAMP superfamily)